jgi:hypothetical protein
LPEWCLGCLWQGEEDELVVAVTVVGVPAIVILVAIDKACGLDFNFACSI